MKPKNVLKIGFLAVAGALLSVGVKAQTLPQPTSGPTLTAPVTAWADFATQGEAVDTVTVGSRMPYKVEDQNTGSGLTFEYKWLFSNNNLTVLDDMGGGISATSDNYYANNEISVVMDADVDDLITINTNVRSLFSGTVLCTGTTDDTYDVRVVDRPKIDWDTSTAVPSCASAANVSIPLTKLDGYKQFEIEYHIDYYTAIDKTGGVTTNGTTKYLVLTGNTIELPASEFASGTGLYEVTVTGITDRISRKSADQTLVASQAGDLPTNNAYPVIIYPTPTTKPLQHIQNVQP